jgi:hypothetical protein
MSVFPNAEATGVMVALQLGHVPLHVTALVAATTKTLLEE